MGCRVFEFSNFRVVEFRVSEFRTFEFQILEFRVLEFRDFLIQNQMTEVNFLRIVPRDCPEMVKSVRHLLAHIKKIGRGHKEP